MLYLINHLFTRHNCFDNKVYLCDSKYKYIKVMPRYSEGKVYKIINDCDDEIYVGSTCDSLSRRMSGHRRKSKVVPERKIYVHFDIHGVSNFRIVLIENYPCSTKTNYV